MSSINKLRLNLHSELQLAQRFERVLKTGSLKEAHTIINSCKTRRSSMWRDHENSEPEKGKYIRMIEPGSSFKRLLDLIDGVLFKPFDSKLPPFVYGGVQAKSSIDAAISVLKGKNRTLLKLDMRHFYEQITKPRIITMLVGAGCTGEDFVEFLADVCSVPEGPKGSTNLPCLARGFPPSTRIATWVALPFMVAIESYVKRVLKGHNPRVAFFIDDIGISAQNVTKERMGEIEAKILQIAQKYNIEMNTEKTKTYLPKDEQEILGVAKLEDIFFPGKKTRERKALKIKVLQEAKSKLDRTKAHNSLRGFAVNKRTIKRKSKTGQT